MSGLAIYLIGLLTVLITSPGLVGRWLAEVQKSYDRHLGGRGQ